PDKYVKCLQSSCCNQWVWSWVYSYHIMNATLTHDKISLLQLAFSGLEDRELQEMAALTDFKTYPPDHILCHEGKLEDEFYIIAEGSVIISKTMGEENTERVLRVGGKGDIVGEMSMIQNLPRSATVRTTTECTVLEMERQDFEDILSHSPRMAIDIIRITLDRMRANDKTMIEDLQKSNKILRQLDRNKLEFIQVAAHELRTPLTVLKGYVNVLRSFAGSDANASLGDVIQGIFKGTERITEVVNLMLDVTRIDSDQLKVASVPVSLRHVIEDLVKKRLYDAAISREIKIVLEHPEEAPYFKGDPGLLEKAMYQLIVNAIKYTPDGGTVTVSTRVTTMDEDIPCVEIVIKDTGIGLDEEHHELIFEKFYQVGGVELHSSGKTTFKGGGPGLGLAIVRGVAHAHSGKVWVESTGHDETNFPGSTFYLQLPLDAQKTTL
ncbi:MAG TPA: ATP-binding protein, partial [Anaerolineales bacterium]|nr:ATP-binding protein [Anaerolineales bacterium]